MALFYVDGISLEQRILNLLKRGQRADSQEFQELIKIYGKQKIGDMAQRLLDAEKQREPGDDEDAD